MTPAPIPPNEQERLAALHEYRILNTAPEREFDDIAMIASRALGTPIALVSLVGADEQWFKAKVGMAESGTGRDVSFCAHAILGNDVMVVPDATADPRFADNPLVRNEPRIRFYAGAPLATPDGRNLGTLCVIDRTAHDLDANGREVLMALSRQVVALLEFRRTAARLACALESVKTLAALVPMCAWCRKVRTDEGFWLMLERYLMDVAGTQVSHGICPDCSDEHLGSGLPVRHAPATGRG